MSSELNQGFRFHYFSSGYYHEFITIYFSLFQSKREVPKKSEIGIWYKTRDEFAVLERRYLYSNLRYYVYT